MKAGNKKDLDPDEMKPKSFFDDLVQRLRYLVFQPSDTGSIPVVAMNPVRGTKNLWVEFRNPMIDLMFEGWSCLPAKQGKGIFSSRAVVSSRVITYLFST